LRYCWCKYRA